ncbi:hypothetical protein F5X68DRAFT_77039 [Plectosphaerella plurivora]|uniref:Uncharacterized protein n=1 Tax=Plectosphaerella plurivora TaxID=936078 RepID=A0A9P8VEC3_9PEZI|nr:hypothetical protein F5X68DRAFT_77039 [Plectosphaerella plurivora]
MSELRLFGVGLDFPSISFLSSRCRRYMQWAWGADMQPTRDSRAWLSVPLPSSTTPLRRQVVQERHWIPKEITHHQNQYSSFGHIQTVMGRLICMTASNSGLATWKLACLRQRQSRQGSDVGRRPALDRLISVRAVSMLLVRWLPEASQPIRKHGRDNLFRCQQPPAQSARACVSPQSPGETGSEGRKKGGVVKRASRHCRRPMLGVLPPS